MILHCFLIFICISNPLLAHIVIDVDHYYHENDIKKGVKKGVRVSVFDTDKQKYESIRYYAAASSSKDRFPTGSIAGDPYKDTTINLTISWDGTITVPDGVSTKGYIFRALGKIVHTPKIDIRPGQYILESLMKYSKQQNNGSDFTASYYKQDGTKEKDCTFSNLNPNQEKNRDERGVIGELATTLTMLSFGYKKLPSQNGSKHGFDGVFIDDSEEPELFLTESKCWNKKETAKTTLKDSLSHQKINDRVTKTTMADTKKTLENFLMDKKKKCFLFVHRIKNDGSAQCEVQEFDHAAYIATLRPKLDVQAITGVTSRFAKDSPQKVKAEEALKTLTTQEQVDALKSLIEALTLTPTPSSVPE